LTGGVATLPVAFVTALVSAVLAGGWLIARRKGATLRAMNRRQSMSVLLVGALGSGLVPLLGILAMTVTTASNRALFQSAYPAATAVAARLLLGERFRALTYGLIAVVCAGLVLVNLESSSDIRLGWPFWLLSATLPLIGLSDVIAKRSLEDISPEVVAVGRALGGTLILALALPWFLPELLEGVVRAWPWLLAAGTCMGVFAVALYQVFDHTEASIAASLIALAPLLTLALEALTLGVELSALQWAGFVLVLAAILALARRA
ncbi:MAG: EamA family transporter, partial [Gammaproteobacteria bacterium]|nr:EamA family transporter [Gammaproteobacteria bacterium]